MKPLLALLPFCLALQGCMPTLSRAPDPCQYSADDEEKLQAAVNAAYRWEVPASLILGLLEPAGPPWVKPRVLDWDEYRMQSESWQASPESVADSAHFIGWFSKSSQQRIQLQGDQIANHYMALRLGHGGYHRGLDSASASLTGDARQAQLRTEAWRRRIQRCPTNLTADVKGDRWWKILN